jgi:hypothetical protein
MNAQNPLEDLKDFRKMMETSSKFLSLSGLSGISAGIIALLGSGVAWYLIDQFQIKALHFLVSDQYDDQLRQLDFKLMFLAITILILAVGSGFLFTYLTAKKRNQNLFQPISFKLAWSLGLPLAFGGAFTLILVHHQVWGFIGASTLMFYGLALLNASKYVHVEIKYLAICQMILGLLSAWFSSNMMYSLYFWAIGFGALHIIYGTIMYFKYDRK